MQNKINVELNFSLGEYADRLAAVRAQMSDKGIDTLLVTNPSNMAWLTGYDGWSFYVHQCVIISSSGGAPLWYGRAMDANGAKRTSYLAHENILSYTDHYIQNPDAHPMDFLCQEFLEPRGWTKGTIAVEMDNYYFTAKAYQQLVIGAPQANFVDATGLVNWCRSVKSPQEIAYMRVAARIVENMHHAIYDMIEPGLPKNRLVGEIYRVGCEGVDGMGGDYPAIVPLLPTGADASAAHLTWDDKPFRLGEGTFFEVAGCYKRYHCPLSRTIFLGTPPDKFIRAEAALQEGLENGLMAAKPGNRCADIALELQKAMVKYGIDRGGSRCGYSIGLSYPPDWGEHTMSLRDSDMTILKPGMLFHFMPGIWQDDWGLELTETILITETGAEPLCHYPRTLQSKG